MAYDTNLAKRIEKIIAPERDFVIKHLFGGVAFMVNGNMACGVYKDSLITRVEPDHTAAALDEPWASPFDISGRPMQGWILVASEGITQDEALQKWVHKGVKVACSLLAKQ